MEDDQRRKPSTTRMTDTERLLARIPDSKKAELHRRALMDRDAWRRDKEREKRKEKRP